MSAGHIVAGQCVDVAASSDAYFSTLQPVASATNPAYFTVASKNLNDWYLLTYSGPDLVSSTLLASPIFASCDTTEQFMDGLAVGWGIVAAMVAAWAIHVLRRGL